MREQGRDPFAQRLIINLAVQTTLQTIRTPSASIPSELDTPSTTDVFGANVASATSTGGSNSSISASPEASSGGMSPGATGGLIGGGIALLLIALAFAGFLYRRKQQKVMQEAYGKPEDEKFGMASAAAPMGGAGAAASFNEKHHSQASTFASQTPAPQLQVRVVSQFAPILNVDQGSYQPSSNANGLIAPGAALAAAAVVAAKPKEQAVPVKRFSYQERAEQVQARRQSQQMLAQQQFQAPQQFGQQPQQFQAPQQQFQPQQAPAPFVPVPMTYQKPAPKPVNVPAIAIPDSADFAPPVNPFASNTPSSPSIVDLATPTTPGTPTVLVAGAAGAALPVYRVIMEFKPSMGDEIELIPGDLVRLMHEYDDGWALCSRMNGSHQGVCPRTCLSPRPVKPRPRNGTVGSQSGPAPFSPVAGPNNGSRPGTPTGMRGPQQPQAQQARPQTPTGMRQPPLAKPATPTQYKAFTPSSRPSTPKIQSRPQTPTGQRSTQATPQSSPPRAKEPVAPSSPIVPSILVSPSDEQPASPILGPVKVESAVKVPSPLAKEEKAEEVKTEETKTESS